MKAECRKTELSDLFTCCDESAGTPSNTSATSTLSLLQLTVPSHVSDDVFALNAKSSTDKVMIDSGAAHSACPSEYVNDTEVREVQHKIQFQTASEEFSSIMVRNSSRT